MVKPSLSIIDKIYKAYHKSPDKMLIHTGVIGWMLSSAAQITAILFNDKLSKEQKLFMIPQEFADAVVNIASFYIVTQTFTSVASKLVRTGKWLPQNVRNYLIKNNFGTKLGDINFNIPTAVRMPYKVKRSYNFFEKGLGVVATTIGSILSCNIITPILRNMYASKRQQTGITKINDTNNTQSGKYYNTLVNVPQYRPYSCKSNGLKV